MEMIELKSAKSYIDYNISELGDLYTYGDWIDLDIAKKDYTAIFFDKYGNAYNHDDIKDLKKEGYSFNI
jgi:hypothetical protein